MPSSALRRAGRSNVLVLKSPLTTATPLTGKDGLIVARENPFAFGSYQHDMHHR